MRLARYSHRHPRWRCLAEYFLQVSCRGDQMGEVVQFIRKPDPDRAARLIQEARAIYESIFPTETANTAPIRDDDTSRCFIISENVSVDSSFFAMTKSIARSRRCEA